MLCIRVWYNILCMETPDRNRTLKFWPLSHCSESALAKYYLRKEISSSITQCLLFYVLRPCAKAVIPQLNSSHVPFSSSQAMVVYDASISGPWIALTGGTGYASEQATGTTIWIDVSSNFCWTLKWNIFINAYVAWNIRIHDFIYDDSEQWAINRTG